MTMIDPAELGPSPRVEPDASYLAALKRYEPSSLRRMIDSLGEAPPTPGRSNASALEDRLRDPEVREAALAPLDPAARLALAAFSLAESPALPMAGVALTLRLLGRDPASIAGLVRTGLVAVRPADSLPPPSPESSLSELRASGPIDLILHPAILGLRPDEPPDGLDLEAAAPGDRLWESDGLEPILRLATLWQRVVPSPLRQTQQGTLYKRDRERIFDDPALAGPLADAIEPLPDMVALWLALGLSVGLLEREPQGDRILAASDDFWAEHAVHLPQMLGARWLGLKSWHDRLGGSEGAARGDLSTPFVRIAAMLTLAAQPANAWIDPAELADRFDRLAPGWHLPALEQVGGEAPADLSSRSRNKVEDPEGVEVLEGMLLGTGYQLGLIRSREGRRPEDRTIQITELGRYALGMGPPPPPRDTFEQFLFVQPNFEIIAYRQGLNPWLVGLFSRFLDWTQLGSALALKLSPESVYRGLEGALKVDQIVSRLERHGGRALPSGVAEAIKTWSGRRARLTYHASATLLEFASGADLEAALASWPGDPQGAGVARVADRILLIEGGGPIPYQSFQIVGQRDYRRASEPCVDVGPDGVELRLDLGRSDLFIESELARIAEDQPPRPGRAGADGRVRRFVITRRSLGKAVEDGMTASQIERWFEARTGAPMPPAVRLLLRAAQPGAKPALRSNRSIVVTAASPDLLDGLAQHPSTRELLGRRLGPEAIEVSEALFPRLLEELDRLGLGHEGLSGASADGAGAKG